MRFARFIAPRKLRFVLQPGRGAWSRPREICIGLRWSAMERSAETRSFNAQREIADVFTIKNLFPRSAFPGAVVSSDRKSRCDVKETLKAQGD